MSTEGSDAVSRFLVALTSALTAHGLYLPGHPRAEASLTELEDALARLFEDGSRDPVTLMVVDSDLAIDGVPWRKESPTRRSLVRKLERAGAERLGLARGVTRDELRAVVSALVSRSELESTPHVELGRVALRDTSERGTSWIATSTLEHVLDEITDRYLALADELEPALADLDRLTGTLIELAAGSDRAFVLHRSLRDLRERLARHAAGTALGAAALGARMGLAEDLLHQLTLGALLHDVGWVGLPDEIALERRPGPATDAAIRNHPLRGAALLASARRIAEVPILIAAQHHLSRDGSAGYPEPLERPCLAARVVSVADAWDVYLDDAGGSPPGAAAARASQALRRLAGTTLDSRLVDVFLELVPSAT